MWLSIVIYQLIVSIDCNEWFKCIAKDGYSICIIFKTRENHSFLMHHYSSSRIAEWVRIKLPVTQVISYYWEHSPDLRMPTSVCSTCFATFRSIRTLPSPIAQPLLQFPFFYYFHPEYCWLIYCATEAFFLVVPKIKRINKYWRFVKLTMSLRLSASIF